MRKIIIITYILINSFSYCQSSDKFYLLVYSDVKQKIKIDKHKYFLKAIELDSTFTIKDDIKLTNVFFNEYSDRQYENCQKGDSVYISTLYSNDTFEIDSTNGKSNQEKIIETLRNKKKLFSVKINSNRLIGIEIKYYYALVKCNACVGKLDAKNAIKYNIDNILLIKNNIQEIPEFNLDNQSFYKLYLKLIKQ